MFKYVNQFETSFVVLLHVTSGARAGPAGALSGLTLTYVNTLLSQRPRSLVPYIMQEMMRDLERPLFDQHFGLGVRPSRLFEEQFSLSPLFSGYLRPRRLRDLEDSGVSSIVNNKDCFKVDAIHIYKCL